MEASSAIFDAAKLAGADAGTEPRIAFDGANRGWVVSNSSGTAVVYTTADRGRSWRRTQGVPAGQSVPSIDVDIVTTRTGRIIANELDFGGINFRTSYSDDGGKTWTASSGTRDADMDRQWLAAGPDDPTTHQPTVYLLFHNLFSGTATHNMWVMRSSDNGASFGPPIPVTLPGSEAWLDLQCADSGGPSSLAVNQKTGRIYAFWGTRSSPAGGCAAQPFEVNVVAATKVWAATSPDDSLGSWVQTPVVDDTTAGNIVGMQLSPGTLDRAGNVWVGSDGGGAFRIATDGLVSYSEKEGLGSHDVLSVFEDAGGQLLAVSRSRKGLFLSRLAGERFEAIRLNVGPRRVFVIWHGRYEVTAAGADGEWWVATHRGLARFSGIREISELSRASPRYELAGENIFRLFRDRQRNIWISLQHGPHTVLMRWNCQSRRIERFPDSGNRFEVLLF